MDTGKEGQREKAPIRYQDEKNFRVTLLSFREIFNFFIILQIFILGYNSVKNIVTAFQLSQQREKK